MRRFRATAVLLLVLIACSQPSSVSSEDAKPSDTSPPSSSLIIDQASESNQESDVEKTTKSRELVELEEIWDLAASRPGTDIGQVFQLFRLKQSLGPRNLACLNPESQDVCERIVEAINIVGLHEKQVALLLESLELPHRVLQRDCELLVVTQEFVAGRVNLAVADGIVTGWGSEGSAEFHNEGVC
ncbi:MAG: hypothetical protein MKZ77_00675 [Acidimicrobiales bacterium]|nr:hypothetical protein [Acidimicrobiales bacterium]